jgi:hypothetical protein
MFCVDAFSQLDFLKYDHYLAECSAHVFHSRAWFQIVKDTFGLNIQIAALKSGPNYLATAPIVYYRNIFHGKSVISLPFSAYYGSIAAVNSDAADALYRSLQEHLSGRISYFQMPERYESYGDLYIRGYSTFIKEILPDRPIHEQVLEGASSRVRAYLRKSIAYGFKVKVGDMDCVDEFYKLYITNMKELGSPPQPKSFYKNILKGLGQRSQILLIGIGAKWCAGMLLIQTNGDEFFCPVIATPRAFQVEQSSFFLYLEAVNQAYLRNCRYMNFGRSIQGLGPAVFKQRFGASEIPLYYYTNQTQAVGKSIDPSKSMLRYAINTWKRLPLSLTVLGGRILAKHIV